MKKFLAILLSAVMIFGATAALADTVTLVYAEVNPITSLMGQTAEFFAEKVAEYSGGTVAIDIQAGGAIGNEADVVDGMVGGAGMVDLCRISNFTLNAYGATQIQLLSLPFLWTGRDHFWTFAASDLGKEILQDPSTKGVGVFGLFYVEEGFRSFFFTEYVADITGLVNKKIRVAPDPIMTGVVESVGANPTSVSFTELYQALDTGVVDGAEQPIANFYSNRFHEVAPYFLMNQHTLGCGSVIITNAAWDRLTAEQQEAILLASADASEFNKNLSASYEMATTMKLLAEGAVMIGVADFTPWQEAVAAVAAESIPAGYEDDYQAIVDMAP
ncbi:MAG: TRAP transporter substrate-binding protein [Bacillota bacterium]